LNKHKEAMKDYNKAIEQDKYNAVAIMQRGHLKLKLGKTEDALLDFEESIRLNPWLKGSRLGKSQVYAMRGNIEGEMQELGEAISLDGSDPTPFLKRGRLLAQTGKHRRAISDLIHAQDLFLGQGKRELAAELAPEIGELQRTEAQTSKD
jgi:tetratricopeptide (TPR) repeat protein